MRAWLWHNFLDLRSVFFTFQDELPLRHAYDLGYIDRAEYDRRRWADEYHGLPKACYLFPEVW